MKKTRTTVTNADWRAWLLAGVAMIVVAAWAHAALPDAIAWYSYLLGSVATVVGTIGVACYLIDFKHSLDTPSTAAKQQATEKR